ncbi:MAG: sulfatase [Verrucomicrobiota bacterium]
MKRLFVLFILLGTASVASPSKPPNILFCIADDASFEHFGVNGCTWVNTPNIDRLAADGINFVAAYTPNPKCAPSRSVILTGRNPWQLGAAANHYPIFPEAYKTYSEALSEYGYEIAYTGKGWGPGTARGRNMTGKHYEKFRQADVPAGGINKNEYTRNFDYFLDKRDQSKPFVFWFGCKEPHRNYEFKSGVKNGKTLESIDTVPAYWPDNETVRHDMLDYAVEVEHFDKHVGGYVEVLRKRGLLDNTLIIVTSDNGMPFPRVKGHPYHHAAHMPFVAHWPKGINDPGRTFEQFVSFTDLAPTFLDIAGLSLAESGMQDFAGRSLNEIFKGNRNMAPIPERTSILMGRERNDVGRPKDWGYPVRAIRQGNLFYIHNFEPTRWPCGNPSTGFRDTDKSPTKTAIYDTGVGSDYWNQNLGKRPKEELYDVSQDPDCVDNLATNPEYATQMAALQTELFRQLEAEGDLRMSGKGEWYEAQPYSRESSRNAYEKVKNGEERSGGKFMDIEDGM